MSRLPVFFHPPPEPLVSVKDLRRHEFVSQYTLEISKPIEKIANEVHWCAKLSLTIITHQGNKSIVGDTEEIENSENDKGDGKREFSDEKLVYYALCPLFLMKELIVNCLLY